jgi:cellulose synthase/poly-beta-1,6-N-acetylglucosamine synthase-like glycosyltransferase
MESNEGYFPFISILVAARDEEASIEACLQALEQQVYPPGRWEVLLADDGSLDQTAALASAFMAGKPGFRLFHTPEGSAGKAHALAMLGHHARGEVWLFTDADTLPPPHWAKSMAAYFQDASLGVVAGPSLAFRPDGRLATWQALEWLWVFQLLQWAGNWQIPVTAAGHNMAVRKVAYLATGGYENLPFSATEDFQLFHEVVKKGWKFHITLQADTLVKTRGTGTLRQWAQQRLRWGSGARELPAWLLAFPLLTSLWIPLIIVLFTWSPLWASGLALGKLLFTALTCFSVLMKVNRKKLAFLAFFLDFYLSIAWLAMILLFFFPFTFTWKRRKFTM